MEFISNQLILIPHCKINNELGRPLRRDGVAKIKLVRKVEFVIPHSMHN